MTRSIVAVGACLLAGCATTRPATAENVRQTADGGTVLLRSGDEPQAAARHALAIMRAQCGPVFEIVEMRRAGTGLTYIYGNVAIDEHGTAYTFLCHPPKSLILNESLEAFASQDLLGGPCSSNLDCGVHVCSASPPRICTMPDGSVPFARLGESCGAKPCVFPLTCFDWGSGAKCRKM